MTRAREISNVLGRNIESTTFTATAGQTAFSITHAAGRIQVYMNGLLLDPTVDWTSDGSTVTLTEGAIVGDELEVVKFDNLAVADAIPRTGHTGTIDFSNATFTPAVDQIMQVKKKRILGNTQHTSSTYTAVGHDLSFSAKNSSSLLKISVQLNVSIGGVTSTDAGMKWAVFKDGVNLAANSQVCHAFYYMYNNTHNNSHLNQSAVFYADASDTSSHNYEVYTAVSHGSCQAKTSADWGTQFIEIMEIAQ